MQIINESNLNIPWKENQIKFSTFYQPQSHFTHHANILTGMSCQGLITRLETQTYPNHVAEQNIGIYIRMIQIYVWPLKMAALIASSLF